MTEEQYLLTCLAEECAEVAKCASKAIRFGLYPDDRRPGSWRVVDNRAGLEQELGDILALAEMLGLRAEPSAGKAARVREFMVVSRRIGALDPEV